MSEIFEQALRAQQAVQQANGGKNPGIMRVACLRDVDVGGGLSLRSVSLDKPICYANQAVQNRGASRSAFGPALNAVTQKLSEVNQGGVQWYKEISSTLAPADPSQIFGREFSGHGLGGFGKGGGIGGIGE